MVNRREFLELSVAAGLTAIMPPDQLGITLDDQRTVMTVALTLFAHGQVSERPYHRAVEYVARQCERRSEVNSAVKLAVRRLEWSSGWQYAQLPESQRVRLLQAMQGTKEFHILYCELLEGLYRTPQSWQLLLHV
jgi:hypothetical protein